LDETKLGGIKSSLNELVKVQKRIVEVREEITKTKKTVSESFEKTELSLLSIMKDLKVNIESALIQLDADTKVNTNVSRLPEELSDCSELCSWLKQVKLTLNWIPWQHTKVRRGYKCMEKDFRIVKISSAFTIWLSDTEAIKTLFKDHNPIKEVHSCVRVSLTRDTLGLLEKVS
jgi:hypothetical protein